MSSDLSSLRSGGIKMAMPLTIIALMASAVILQFGFIFLLLAILPTIVIFFTDNSPGKSAFKVVGSCNFAATLPYLAPIIHVGRHFGHYDISFLLSNMTAWLIIYGAAAGGWCLIFLCRVIANFIVILVYEYSRTALESVQTQLVEEWGQRVTQKN